MGTTIIGGGTTPLPMTFSAPIVEVASSWGAEWQLQPDCYLVKCGVYASSTSTSYCEIKRTYGNVKEPFASNFQIKTDLDLGNQWVRISFPADQGNPRVIFVGVIMPQTRDLMGSATLPSAVQIWRAYGGLSILQKIFISKSVYFVPPGGAGGSPKKTMVEWIPAMNARDRKGILVGNSTNDIDGNYYYGGQNVWTHLQYLKYLISNFIQQEDGPTWTVAGQTDVLDSIKTTIRFPEVATAADLVRDLIPVTYGIDFIIEPTDAGYQIRVFALTALDIGFKGVNIPKNPNTVSINRTENKHLFRARVVQTNERRVDRVEVIGKRIVVCGTLVGARVSNLKAQTSPDTTKATLIPKWSTAIETDYIGANGLVAQTPTAGALVFDEARKDKVKYGEVYCHYGAPLNWDMDGGSWSVMCNDDGSITKGPYQNVTRETVNWIPLKQGFDYTQQPPVDNTVGGVYETNVQTPLAWIYNENFIAADSSVGGSTWSIKPRYQACFLDGIHVGVPYLDWGVHLSAHPQHQMARNHWSDTQLQTTVLDFEQPDYDHQTLIATVAIESDHRIRLAYQLPANLAAGDGSVMTIHHDDAEMWCVLPNTAVSIDTDGTILTTSAAPQILRNDTDRLALVLAGAIVRYAYARAKGDFGFRGFFLATDLMGAICTVYQEGDNSQAINSPLTEMEWVLDPSPQSTIKAGYA